jgi:hypothetical protein
MTTVIKVENLWKQYRLGTIGGKTLREDMSRWWAKLRGKPDPNLPISHPASNIQHPATATATSGPFATSISRLNKAKSSASLEKTEQANQLSSKSFPGLQRRQKVR